MFKNKQNNVLLECGKHLIVMHELQLFVAPFVKSERAKLIEKKKTAVVYFDQLPGAPSGSQQALGCQPAFKSYKKRACSGCRIPSQSKLHFLI